MKGQFYTYNSLYHFERTIFFLNRILIVIEIKEIRINSHEHEHKNPILI